MKDTTGKKTKVEFSLATIQGNSATRKQLEGLIEEIILAKKKMDDIKLELKGIFAAGKDMIGIPPKVLNKLAKENKDPGGIEAEANELHEIQQIAEALELAPVAQFTP
jgi:hypothetical protein